MTPTVLIVEDDQKIAAVVARNLEAAGMRCHIVHDGTSAYESFERLNPDVTVLDIMVPGTDECSTACCRLHSESCGLARDSGRRLRGCVEG